MFSKNKNKYIPLRTNQIFIVNQPFHFISLNCTIVKLDDDDDGNITLKNSFERSKKKVLILRNKFHCTINIEKSEKKKND